MNTDERNIYQEIKKRASTWDSSGSYSDVAAIRTLSVHIEKHLPSEFFKVLNDDSSLLSTHPGLRLEQLSAILLAYDIVPEKMRRRLEVSVSADQLDPLFELNREDKESVLNHCASMREIIWKSQSFDVAHRRRLLDRVGAIEREVHLPKGRLDVVLGGVSDVGEALGKFGRDVKPLFERMKDIAGLTRKATSEYDQLPPPEETKRLPPPEKPPESDT